MKKSMAMLLVCLMALCVLPTTLAAEHTHAAGEEWDRDEKEHWHLCECGEKMDIAEHVMDDEYYTTLCSVCGSDIWAFEGLYTDIRNYDEYGNLTRYTALDGEGNLIEEYFYLYEYDEEGNMLHSEQYWDEVLVEEDDYALGFFGEYLVKTQIVYYEGIVSSVVEYDEYGNCVKMVMYDEEGNVSIEEATQYEYNEEGEVLHSEQVGSYSDGSVYKEVRNEYNDQISWVYYDENGEVLFEIISEYEYDENGNVLSKKNYHDGVLSDESIYVVVEDEWGDRAYEQMYIGYLEDGAKEVYEYNEHGDNVREIAYDAEGNIVYEYRYEYGYDENDNIIWEKIYDGERLTYEATYVVIETEEEYIYYMSSTSEYAEDGSKLVIEYDHNGKVISEKEYTAEEVEGTELEEN